MTGSESTKADIADGMSVAGCVSEVVGAYLDEE